MVPLSMQILKRVVGGRLLNAASQRHCRREERRNEGGRGLSGVFDVGGLILLLLLLLWKGWLNLM